MKIIDAHTHWYPPANGPYETWTRAHAEPYWRSILCPPDAGEPLLCAVSEDEFLRAMDAAGVERAVILGNFWQRAASCGEQNALAEAFVRAHPDRISAFAAVCPNDPAHALETAKSARERGFCGLGELCDFVQGFAYDSEAFREILDVCGMQKLAVNIHMNDNEGPEYPGKYFTDNEAVFCLAEEFPDVSFIAAHFSGGEALRGRTLPKNVWFDSAASPLLYGEDVWKNAAAHAERFLFGTDYALRLYPQKQRTADFEMIVDEARRNLPVAVQPAIFGENAGRAIAW